MVVTACGPEQPLPPPEASLTLGWSSLLSATASSLASYSACTWSLFFNTLCGRQKGEACNTEFTEGPLSPRQCFFIPFLPQIMAPRPSHVLLGQSGCVVTCDMDSRGSRVVWGEDGGGRRANLFINSYKCFPIWEERG